MGTGQHIAIDDTTRAELEALRANVLEERNFNETWIPLHIRDGHPRAAERRREVVAERDRWLAALDVLLGENPAVPGMTNNPKLVYLSGGIAGLSTEECNAWRSRAKELFDSCIRGLDPMRHDYRGRRVDDVAVIVDDDLRDIDCCDALLVRVEQPSWGTAMEIRYAWQLGKPIIAWGQPNVASAWFEHHCTVFYRTIDEAVNHLNGLLAPVSAVR